VGGGCTNLGGFQGGLGHPRWQRERPRRPPTTFEGGHGRLKIHQGGRTTPDLAVGDRATTTISFYISFCKVERLTNFYFFFKKKWFLFGILFLFLNHLEYVFFFLRKK
jgi:hypothetical protein